MAAKNNFIEGGENKRAKEQVWIGLEKLKPYFIGLSLTNGERREFKSLVEQWGRDFITAYGEYQVTHYIVS